MAHKHIMAADESLHIYSMGKRLRVTAIFSDYAEANTYMDKHDDQAVIASFGPFVLLANMYDKGEPVGSHS